VQNEFLCAQLLQCDVIWLRKKANLVQCRGWEMLAHPPTLNISPRVITGSLLVKEHLQRKQSELEDDTNIAVTDFSHCLSKDEHRSATDHLPCRWEKCVNNPGNYSEYRIYVQTFTNISNVLPLSFVNTIKSYTQNF
jgi:hypothetical protein